MIGLRDATMLALTKLRTRKVRLTVTIVVSGLLFSALAGASLIVRGSFQSIREFNQEGLGSRFMVQSYPVSATDLFTNKDILDRANAIYKDTVERKKAAAKSLGIEYSQESETPPFYDNGAGPGSDKQRFLNFETPAAIQAVQEYTAAHPGPGEKELKQAAEKYNPKAYYSSVPYIGSSALQMGPGSKNNASLQVLKNGKETSDGGSVNEFGMSSDPTSSFASSWQTMSDEMIQPFVLSGQATAVGSDGSIPIVIPRGAAEQMLGLEPLPSSASSSQQLARTKEIRDKAGDLRFQVCYRNSTSANLSSQATSAQNEKEQNKNNKDYREPALVYGIPNQACGEVPIIRDARSSSEKTYAAKQTQFNQMFGEEKPTQQTLSFRIIGLVPDPDYGTGAFSIGAVVRSIVTSSLGSGWYMPDTAANSNPLVAKFISDTLKNPLNGGVARHVEFNTSQDARNFVKNENCEVDFSRMPIPDSSSPYATCIEQGKLFTISPYGSNSLALDDAGRIFAKFFRVAALIIAAIGAIIMMGTVGRMIADSRRETAVFRAIGAKRMDIAQIYITYAILLSLLVAAFSLLIGFAFALFVDARWSPGASIDAVNAFNAADLNKKFALYGFYLPDILTIIGLSLAAGLLSAGFPLMRNLRRNPIRDMRDDT